MMTTTPIRWVTFHTLVLASDIIPKYRQHYYHF